MNSPRPRITLLSASLQSQPPSPPFTFALEKMGRRGTLRAWSPGVFFLHPEPQKTQWCFFFVLLNGEASASYCPCQSSRVNPAPPPMMRPWEALGQRGGTRGLPGGSGGGQPGVLGAQSSPWMLGKAQPCSLACRDSHSLPKNSKSF